MFFSVQRQHSKARKLCIDVNARVVGGLAAGLRFAIETDATARNSRVLSPTFFTFLNLSRIAGCFAPGAGTFVRRDVGLVRGCEDEAHAPERTQGRCDMIFSLCFP